MKKINLFIILAYKEQTYIYMDIINKMEKNYKNGIKTMETTLSYHYFMLSKYFNIFNFYEYEDQIEAIENAIIYHLPYGRDNKKTDVEQKLLKFKGKIPIIMRSYDPHSPLKTSKTYMEKYHDYILTYLVQHINNKNIVFANMNFDNHLVLQYFKKIEKPKFACMILRRETRVEYFEDNEKFKKNNLDLIKTYDLREKIVQYEEIDIYGRNWPKKMKNYKGILNPHLKKYSILNEYKFNFIIENAIVDNFLSEKILDSFISLSVPIYLGSPSIEKWIPRNCFIDIRNFKNHDELINYIKHMSNDEYLQYITNILKHRDKIFDLFSTKENFAKLIYKWYKKNFNNNLQYNNLFFDQIENDIINLKLKKEHTLKVFFNRLKKYIKRKISL